MAKRRVLGGLLFSAAALVLSPAHADPDAFMLSTDVPNFVIQGVTYDVNAVFSFDTTTDLESSVDIILTGSGSYAGSYLSTPAIIDAVHSQVSDNRDICGQLGSDAICLRFVDTLGTTPDPLQIIAAGDQAPNLNAPATGFLNVSNGAEAVPANPAVPEPGSLSLLAVGILGGGLVVKRRKTGFRSV